MEGPMEEQRFRYELACPHGLPLTVFAECNSLRIRVNEVNKTPVHTSRAGLLKVYMLRSHPQMQQKHRIAIEMRKCDNFSTCHHIHCRISMHAEEIISFVPP
ncbi:hypothetical protein CEXT_39841 [Caerostris extrusa]|uniref:Uncharacterized protein n=1 Tax=Caerostris extrusa TaxID=172846 RepID=A0AAV4WPA6_CAEEX|nr:hypothetical protein CEXT_39841 [Caerostris extrusa]